MGEYWRAGLGRALPWLPFGLGVCGLAWRAWSPGLGLDLLTLFLAVLLGALWWVGRRLWALAAVFTVLALPLLWHFSWQVPRLQAGLARLPPGQWVWVEGTIRDRWQVPGRSAGAEARQVQVLLGEARVFTPERAWPVAELQVRFAAPSAWTFQPPRLLRLGGVVAEQGRAAGTVVLTLSPVDTHFVGQPTSPWSWEALRLRLRDRSAYYLGKTAQAMFLPLVLDLRDRESPEGRQVVLDFRRVGVSHLFAISGMNVAMIFGLLMVLQRYAVRGLVPRQGWVHARTWARLLIVLLIWAYIALVGFSSPAVRAAIMGSLLIWSDLWGTRTPGLYVLVLTGLLMLAVQPSLLYEVSFQLSFLAYFFLVLALALGRRRGAPRSQGWRAWVGGGIHFVSMNLLVTGVITLGLWPVIAARFGNLSLLVFAGNLLLVPVMELLLLPCAMLVLVISLAQLGAAPGTGMEGAAYALLEVGLRLWLLIVRVLERLGGSLVFRFHLDWSSRQFCLYYVSLMLLLAGALWTKRLAQRYTQDPTGPPTASAGTLHRQSPA